MMGLVMALLLGSSLGTGLDVEWIAHRGESADAPENTMAAFQLAWERGVQAIELDVHLSRDGILVVSHDADTKRTAGVERSIQESNAKDLCTLDVGRWKDPRWEGQRIPLLREALSTIPEDGRCFIEVKVGPEAIPALVDEIRSCRKRPDQLAIISFNAETIAEAKKALPHIKAYYLASFKQTEDKKGWTPSVDSLIEKAKEIHADGLDLSSKGPIDHDFVRKVKGEGLAVYVWTVDDPDEARRLIQAGVDGITSNRAAWMSKHDSK
jgi:glycerophosphoryl diester phosphodiesterase